MPGIDGMSDDETSFRTGGPPPDRRRLSMVDDAYQAIKARVLSNDMPPGYQALEHEVAAELGMSRTPVREALIRLANEGLLDIVPRRGMRVVPLSPNDMREIYEVLYSVEATAAELLAEHPNKDQAIAELDTATDAMEAALEIDDLEAWAAADDRFHRALMEHSGNSRLQTIAGMYTDQSHRARNFTLRLREKPVLSTTEHRDLVEALRRGDPSAAREIHRAHRRRAGAELLEIIRKYRLNHL